MIHELARFEIRPEALDEVLAAIHEFVAYVRKNEPGALRYEVWQEEDHPTRFVHVFVWRDEEAKRVHGESAAVKKLAGILYPKCLAPVEFTRYRQVDSNAPWPFADPENTVVFTTHYVLDERHPIVRVVRDREDGSWQVHAAPGVDNAEPRLVALSEIAELDPTFRELADLPAGWTATREGPGGPWKRQR